MAQGKQSPYTKTFFLFIVLNLVDWNNIFNYNWALYIAIYRICGPTSIFNASILQFPNNGQGSPDKNNQHKYIMI